MEPSSLFGPTTWESLVLAPGRKEAVRKVTPGFPKWAGASPGSDYGGKPIVDFEGRPAFAELVILWTVNQVGWDGVWVTHAGGREKHRRGFWGPQEEFQLPDGVLKFLSDVRSKRGDSSRGTWDIVCWPRDATAIAATDLRFIESKWGGKDGIKLDQIDWYRVARESGVSREAFLIVEWNLRRPLNAST
jgi:hypothetical protein